MIKWRASGDDIRDIEGKAEQRLLVEVRTENSFMLVSQSEVLNPGLYDKGLLGAMNYQLHQNPPCTVQDITTSSISDALTTLYYAGCACAVVPTGQVEKAREFIAELDDSGLPVARI